MNRKKAIKEDNVGPFLVQKIANGSALINKAEQQKPI